MRWSSIIALLALAGCQAAAPARPDPGTAPTPQRIPPPVPEPAAPAIAAPANSEARANNSTGQEMLQRVQYVEPGPAPSPESLPPAEPRPVQPDSPTLSDFEQMALASNPSVARAAALVQAARGNYIQVGLHENPTVGYEGQQIGSGGRAEQDGVFFEQEFSRGGKLGLNRQVAAQEWARLEQELAAQQQRVLTDVRIAYYDVLIAQLQEDIYNKLAGFAGKIVEYNQRLQQGGERSRSEVIQVTVERERMLTGSLNAARRRVAAWRQLSAIVGWPHMPLQSLAGSPEGLGPEYEWDAVVHRLMTNSPEIAAAMSNVERARWGLQRALAEKTPNVTVRGLVNWRDEGIGGKPDGSLVVGVPLPIWNRNQGGILQAQGEVAAAERELDQLELDLINRLAPVFERYTNAREYVERYDKLLRGLTDEWLVLNERLQEAGEAAQLDVILFQRTYAQTQLDYLDAVREQRKAEAEIEGLLLSNSLSTR